MLLMKFDYDWPAGLRDNHVWKCGCTDGQTQGRTDVWTPARVTYYKLTLSLRLWWAKNYSTVCILGSKPLTISFRYQITVLLQTVAFHQGTPLCAKRKTIFRYRFTRLNPRTRGDNVLASGYRDTITRFLFLALVAILLSILIEGSIRNISVKLFWIWTIGSDVL